MHHLEWIVCLGMHSLTKTMSDIQLNGKQTDNLQGKANTIAKNKKHKNNGTTTNHYGNHGNKQTWPNLTTGYAVKLASRSNPAETKIIHNEIYNKRQIDPMIVNNREKYNASTSKEQINFVEKIIRKYNEGSFKNTSTSENCRTFGQDSNLNHENIIKDSNDCVNKFSITNDIEGKSKKELKRQCWAENRQRAKEEKRRMKEEEIRRQIISPKSENFKIINSKFKDLVDSTLTSHCHGGVNSSKAKDVDSLSLKNSNGGYDFRLERTLSEFPDLKSSYKVNFNTIRINSRCLPEKNDNEQTQKNTNFTKDCNPVSDNKTNIVNSVRKKIKKGAPIEFNIIIALQSKSKDTKAQSGYRKSTKVLPNKQILSGNKLDSDNPIRKKGKIRENKKKRLSKLKRCLINERQLRKCFAISTSNTFEDNIESSANSNLDKALLYQLVKDGKDSVTPNWKPELNTSTDTDDDINHVENIEMGVSNVKPVIFLHTRKFRSYCNQWPTIEMQESVSNLIKTIVRFQDRHHANDPIKAHARRRYVCGFHEVLRFVKINKAKIIFIATDIECGADGGDGSLMVYINQLISAAEAFNVPYVYSGTRWSMRNTFKKKRPISCVAILNYEGAEEMFKTVISLLPQVKNKYQEKLKALEAECGFTEDVKDDVTGACIKSMLDRLTINDVDEKESAFKDGNNLNTVSLKEEISRLTMNDVDEKESAFKDGNNLNTVSLKEEISRLTMNDVDEKESAFKDGNNLNTVNLKEEISSECPFMISILKCTLK